MSSGEPRRPVEYSGRPLGFYLTLGFFALGVGLILMILLTLSGFGGGTQHTQDNGPTEDPLDAPRETLAHDADVSACRAALQQINVALGNRPADQRPAALDPKQRERLQKMFGLSDDEMNEVAAESYTLLDGWRLDEAFLLRDAATHVLEPEEEGGDLPALTPLERASAAFAWTVREVRLADPTDPGGVPPQFVLRRASGTALERGLVFLDLLQQLGVADEDGEANAGSQGGETAPLQRCLIFCHDKPDDAARLWACGVVVGGGPDVYLFDPRLGMPLPGANGKGVATLSAVCKDPALLEQLNTGADHKYDVTAEQARTAELRLVCSLSEMAPRMKLLEEKVLPPVRVRLARDPEADLQLLEGVARKTEGAKPTVKVWTEGAGLLRRFLPPDEGGSDPVQHFLISSRLPGFVDHTPDEQPVDLQRYQLFQLQLTPWDVMPPLFRNPNLFPINVGLGRRVRDGFMTPFVRLATDPQGPRDRMLRGEFDKAARDLVDVGARMRRYQENRAEAGAAGELEKQAAEWAEKAGHAYADQLRAQENGSPADVAAAAKEVDAAWNRSEPVVTLLAGASAGPALADVTYLLGLCKHEKAEQEQTRLERLLRRSALQEVVGAAGLLSSPLGQGSLLGVSALIPGRTDGPELKEARDDARAAWLDALGWWKKYGDDHPEESAERPSSSPGRAAAVRRMRARAQAMLGDDKAAAATYEDLTGPMGPLAQVAALYQARMMRNGGGKP